VSLSTHPVPPSTFRWVGFEGCLLLLPAALGGGDRPVPAVCKMQVGESEELVERGRPVGCCDRQLETGLLPVMCLGLGVLTGVMLSDVKYLLMTKQQAVLPGWTCA
jgi:hypothetical protein